MINDTNAKIYVACLAAYNSGYLHGEWIDVTDLDTMCDQINSMLQNSPIENAEEWAIHDYEGFGSIKLSEWESIEDVIAYAEFLNEHGSELGAGVLNYSGGLADAKRLIEEAYQGEYQSEADFVEQMANDLYEIPEYLEYYIDYDRMARDWFISDFFSIEVGYQQVHVFRHQ